MSDMLFEGGICPSCEEFIGYDERLRHVPQQRWLDAYAGERRVILRCSDLAAIHQAALAGLGVAALPHFLGAPAETGTQGYE